MGVLVGERLTLRRFTEVDLDAVHAFATDPDVLRYVEWGPNSLDDTRAFLADTLAAYAAEPQQVSRWAITLTEGGSLIGSIELRIDEPATCRGSVGYVLARDQWGHGYATEAARLVLDHGFTTMRLHRIEATCDPRNRASARVLEKAGLEREGVMRGHRFVHGEWGDSALYAKVAD